MLKQNESGNEKQNMSSEVSGPIELAEAPILSEVVAEGVVKWGKELKLRINLEKLRPAQLQEVLELVALELIDRMEGANEKEGDG